MFTPPVPVAAAKLAAPRLDVRAVVRTRLVEQLCASRSPLIAIVAPAGYGKTTLATQVAAHLGGTTAWLRLDSGDDEPARFWSGVAVGLAAAGLPAVVIDTGARPGADSAALAGWLGAHYLPLPRADANQISRAADAALQG